MILFKVDDGEKCKDVKVKVDCEDEETLIVEITSLLLAIGHDHKLRTSFLTAIDVAMHMLEEE